PAADIPVRMPPIWILATLPSPHSHKRYQMVQRKARIDDRAAGKSWCIQLRGRQRCPGKEEMVKLSGRWILNRDIRSPVVVRVVDCHDRPVRTVEQFAGGEP